MRSSDNVSLDSILVDVVAKTLEKVLAQPWPAALSGAEHELAYYGGEA